MNLPLPLLKVGISAETGVLSVYLFGHFLTMLKLANLKIALGHLIFRMAIKLSGVSQSKIPKSSMDLKGLISLSRILHHNETLFKYHCSLQVYC